MSKEYKIWNGLGINNSTIITGITNDTGLTNYSSSELVTSYAIKKYVDNSLDNKLNLSGGTLTGILSGTSLYLSDTLYIGGLSSGMTNKIVYYDTITKILTYDDMGISSQWTTSGTSIFYNGGVIVGSNLQYNEIMVIRKDVPLGIGGSLHLINHNAGIGNLNAETEILFSSRLDSGGTTSRYRYSKIHNIGSGTFGQVGRLSIGMVNDLDNYVDVLNISSNFVGVGYISDPTSGNKFGVDGNTIISGKLFISGLTSDVKTNVIYFDENTKELSYGTLSSSGGGSYSALTYNTITSGNTIQSPGIYNIDFTQTDIFNVNISGNTTTDIIFDFINEIIGKTVVMNVTNTGIGNNTSCIFNPITCKTFGIYDPFTTNAISILCVSDVNPKFWVAIANT